MGGIGGLAPGGKRELAGNKKAARSLAADGKFGSDFV
jgi:hypothetical protein